MRKFTESKEETLKGWSFFMGYLHKVSFVRSKNGWISSKDSKSSFSADMDGETWDYSDDIEDFIKVTNDCVYTNMIQGNGSLTFNETVNLSEWVKSNG